MTNIHLQSLMNSEMTRKQFLIVLAVGIGSILGLETIIKLLTGKSLSSHKLTQDSPIRKGSYGNS